MSRIWNVKIETKIIKNKSSTNSSIALNEKEKRLFYIKINGINEEDAPFKVKTTRNDELFGDEANQFLINELKSSADSEFYWRCAYHGRNKRITLYVIGCDSYNGLLILDDDLYLLSPSSNPSLNHRIELLPSTTKLRTMAEDSAEYSRTLPAKTPNATATSTSTPIQAEFNVSLNLDKNFLNSHLKSTDSRRRYFESLALQTHLTWSYFHHAHQIRLKFSRIGIDDFTDFYQPSQKTHHQNLFNIDPSKFLTKTSLALLYTDLQKSTTNSSTLLHIFLVPKYLLTKDDYDGVTTHRPHLTCRSFNQQPATIILKDKYSLDDDNDDDDLNQNKTQRLLRSIKPSIEQSNLIIDLIGQTLGRLTQTLPACTQTTQFNWHFQVKTEPDLDSNESAQAGEESSAEEGCGINRRLVLSKECHSYCGDGLVDLNEDCDCVEGDLKCAKCCHVKSCRFKEVSFECSRGSCCDDACKIKKKGAVCRRSEGSSCDFEETCDGASWECPADRFVHDGLECGSGGGEGLCWKGKCASASWQCKSIWSVESTTSDEVCFNKFNVIGFENGNCGADWKRKKYEACKVEDAQCGLLNCQLGTEEPSVKTEAYFKSTTGMKGKVYECKVVSGGESAVYVAEGAPCRLSNSTAGMCVARKCTPIEAVISPGSNKCRNPMSKKLCSGNGVCDNFQRCSCKLEWSGQFCENFNGVKNFVKLTTITKTTTSTTSKSTPLLTQTLPNLIEFKSATVLSIIAGLSFILFVFAFFSFLLCRRKESGKPAKKKQSRTGRNSMTLIDLDSEFTKDNGFKHDPRRATLFTFFANNNNQNNPNYNKHQKPSTSHPTFGIIPETVVEESSMQSVSAIQSEMSASKLNMAIQKLNTQPAKSILKKANETNISNNPAEPEPNDTSMRFEHQVNINTILNSAVGHKHRSSRRSLTYDTKRGSICSLTSSSSSSTSSSKSSSPNSSISISSSLSKNNKETSAKLKPNLSFLTNTSSSRSSSTNSLAPTNLIIDSSSTTTNKTDYRKVQDYLNELNHLSQQNTFARLNEKKTPNDAEFRETLLTPVRVNVGSQPLQLHIMKPSDDVAILHSNTSETSSGYMSAAPSRPITTRSKESLFETDDFYSMEKKEVNYNTATPPPPPCLNPNFQQVDKRFSSYSLMQNNSNHLNIHS